MSIMIPGGEEERPSFVCLCVAALNKKLTNCEEKERNTSKNKSNALKMELWAEVCTEIDLQEEIEVVFVDFYIHSLFTVFFFSKWKRKDIKIQCWDADIPSRTLLLAMMMFWQLGR